MKLNKNYLIETILEVLRETDDDMQVYVDNVYSLLADSASIEDVITAYDLYEQLEMFMPEEATRPLLESFLTKIFGMFSAYGEFVGPDKQAEYRKVSAMRDELIDKLGGVKALDSRRYDLLIKSIVVGSVKPQIELLKIGYDFHKAIEEVFGFSPPRSEQFKLWGGKSGKEEMSLRTTIAGKDIEFEFWFDMMGGGGYEEADVVMEPFFRFENKDGMDGFVGVNFDGGVTFDPGEYSGQKKKHIATKELPKFLRNAMGIPLNADVPEWPELPKVSETVSEGKQKLNKSYLFEMINSVLHEDEEDTDDTHALSDKLDAAIKTEEWTHYVQYFDIIETYEMGGLIKKKVATILKERLWAAVWSLDVYDDDNINEIAELFLSHDDLSEKAKKENHSDIYYYGSNLKGKNWGLRYVAKSLGLELKVDEIDEDNLYEISGADGDALEEFKESLIELGEKEEYFEVYTETGGLLFGIMAQAYANFEKKIEEIFGATPSGDPFLAGGVYQTISIKKSIDTPFESPMAKGRKVTADVMFEWSPTHEGGYGMEVTLIPAQLGTTPQTILEDYYGIWVSPAKDGPNIGKLEIGIQNYEDEFADHRMVQNDSGGYGFSRDEMKKKIKELTGVDLNEIN